MRGATALSTGLRRRGGGGGAPSWNSFFNSDSDVVAALILDYGGVEAGQFFANGDNTKTFANLHAFTRASEASNVDNAGLIETVASGEHRLDHNPTTPFARRGLLVEETRKNEFLHSEDLTETVGAWTKDACTISADSTAAPNGATTADKMTTSGGGNGDSFVRQGQAVSSGDDWSFSTFFKKDQTDWVYLETSSLDVGTIGVSYFDLANGVVGTKHANHVASGIEDFGSGWFRCWIVINTVADTNGLFHMGLADDDLVETILRDGSHSIFVWGAQIEKGSFPASYVPTVAATVTRAAEAAPVATSGWSFSATAGSLSGAVTPSHTPNADTGELILFSLNDGTANEKIEVYADASTNVRFRVTDGGVDQCDIDSLVNAVADTELKIAVSWKVNDFAISVNGQTIQVDTGGTLPTVTTLDQCENGHTRHLVSWNTDLSDADLIAEGT